MDPAKRKMKDFFFQKFSKSIGHPPSSFAV